MSENTALVKLSDVPQMSLCSVCPNPGFCCRGFYLYSGGEEFTVWRDDLPAKIAEHAPFEAKIEEVYTVQETDSPDFGREYLRVWWSCPKVTPDGRCSIYQSRPDVCRKFVPEKDSALCVFHKDHNAIRDIVKTG